jgi:succinate dehydrogenase/fumarate reductase flavoprotein subunit
LTGFFRGGTGVGIGDEARSISRRSFVKRAALGSATATALSGLTSLGDTGASVPLEAQATASNVPHWDRVVDIVVVGSGGAGLPAAIRARDGGSSVLIVEENFDIGGHMMISSGSVALGGGTSLQKKYNISDSADQLYLEHTRPDHPMMRFNDREVVRSFADHNLEVFDFLVANGVKFLEVRPSGLAAMGTLTPRNQGPAPSSNDMKDTINGSPGSGLARPLERSARAKGVEILLEHKMTRIVRERATLGRVLGVSARNLRDNKTVNIGARRAVIACTGGSSNNVVIRTIYDPRLTEEYQVGCSPYSLQTGDAEQQGMAIGASLGATSNERNETLLTLQKTAFIGCRYGYARWEPTSPVFHKAGATGLAVLDYQDVILVNAVGQRFYDEMVSGNPGRVDGFSAAHNYFAAALSSAVLDVNGRKQRVGGPIWAIFDSDAVTREKWDPKPPFVDEANGYFFRADTLGQLATNLNRNEFQRVPMSPAALQETATKYNSYVDLGADRDFNKPTPKYKIQTPPFYAAWATPILHDCYTGLRVNGRFQVIDVFGHVIPGFYCAGESAAGMTLHGLGRCTVGGYIAGKNAALEPVATKQSDDRRP